MAIQKSLTSIVLFVVVATYDSKTYDHISRRMIRSGTKNWHSCGSYVFFLITPQHVFTRLFSTEPASLSALCIVCQETIYVPYCFVSLPIHKGVTSDMPRCPTENVMASSDAVLVLFHENGKTSVSPSSAEYRWV